MPKFNVDDTDLTSVFAGWKPSNEHGIITKGKYIESSTERGGNNDLDSVIGLQEIDLKRQALATADILVGAKVEPSWGNVNANGNEGGLWYSNSPSLATAKAGTYAAPALQAPNGGAFFVARVPLGSDPRQYIMREPSSIFGNIDTHLNEIHFIGSDTSWDYYENDVRLFGNISLRHSSHVVGNNTWAGKLDASTLKQINDQLTEEGGEITKLKAELMASANLSEEDIDHLKLATRDILVTSKAVSQGLRNVNSDGSEGGITFGSTFDLSAAKRATYTAPTVAAAAATGTALIRIPADIDARRYQVVIVGLGSDTLNHLAIRILHDDDWQYWEAANFAGEFAVTLRYNPQEVTTTTEWDGKLGDKAVGSIGARDRTLLMTKTDTAQNWHNSGNGQDLPSGVNRKIFAGFSGTKDEAWKELVVNVKYTEAGSPGTDHFGSIHMGTQLGGGQTSDNMSKIYGQGRIDGAELHCRIDLPQRTSFNSTLGKIMIDGASFASTGNERLEVKIWGIK